VNKSVMRHSELLKKPLAIGVIELLPHAEKLPKKLVQGLQPSEEGLYLPGSITPKFRADQSYFYVQAKTLLVVERKGLEIDPMVAGPILNEEGSCVMDRDTYNRFRRLMDPAPNVPASACLLAVGLTVEYLDSLCPYTHAHSWKYNPDNFVLPSYGKEFQDEEYHVAFSDLLEKVRMFVGEDTWNMYFWEVRNTTLILKKMVDFRIYDWHRIKTEEYEESQEGQMAGIGFY